MFTMFVACSHPTRRRDWWRLWGDIVYCMCRHDPAERDAPSVIHFVRNVLRVFGWLDRFILIKLITEVDLIKSIVFFLLFFFNTKQNNINVRIKTERCTISARSKHYFRFFYWRYLIPLENVPIEIFCFLFMIHYCPLWALTFTNTLI